MRLFLLTLLLTAPCLLAYGAIDINQGQYPPASDCEGTATATETVSSEECQVFGANSMKATCTGTRHGAWSIAEYTGTTCGGTASATYPGTDMDSCVTATLINSQFKLDCLVPCTDAASCNNHGTCDAESGICECTDNYSGEMCETAPGGGGTVHACPTASTQCGEHGACNTDQTACECTDGYSGTTCQTAPACATCDDGGHGACNEDFTGCECTGGYTGSTDMLCDVAPACEEDCSAAGHGQCDAEADGCWCYEGYTGDLCTVAPVAGACLANSDQCGEHGQCNDATTHCECTDGYQGNECQIPPTESCSEESCINGDCDEGTCVCQDGWAGANCNVEAADMAVITYFSGSTCTANTQTGVQEVNLDTCTKFPDNLRSGSVLCPNGVNSNFNLKVYGASTTCTGAVESMLGDDHTDCQSLGEGAGSVLVRCAVSGAVAVQASLLLVAALAIFSKYIQ